MLKIPINHLTKLFSLISADRELYVPVESKGKLQFDKWSNDKKVCLDKINTSTSAKDLFFPQNENLVAFKTEGKNISIKENRERVKDFVVFGVRGCDAESFQILDKVFLTEPIDTYYKTRRDHGIVVVMACNEPEETCFCTSFGIDPINPVGDIVVWSVDEKLYWKSITEKGIGFTDKIKDAFDNTDSVDEEILQGHKNEVKKVIERLPLSDLDLKEFREYEMDKLFNSSKWEELSEACIGCGTCTFVCPTCQCYDIRDYDTGHGVQRYRCWDSCMYSDFTKMAHGNPRTSQVERFRQRFMHKLAYFPANNDGVYSCVGCGRCITKCPVSMNIIKVIKALGADKNV